MAHELEVEISKAPLFKFPDICDFRNQELLKTSLDFHFNGFLNLPFSYCLFDIPCRENDEDILYFLWQDTEDKIIRLCTVNKETFLPSMIFGKLNDPKNLSIHFIDKEASDREDEFWQTFSEENVEKGMYWCFQTIMQALLLLNMREYDKEEVIISEKLQKARQKRGKSPLKNYTLIKLNQKIRKYLAEHGERGYKVKPHFRRGHIRHLPNGKMTPVMPCMVNFEGGEIDKKEYRVKL